MFSVASCSSGEALVQRDSTKVISVSGIHSSQSRKPQSRGFLQFTRGEKQDKDVFSYEKKAGKSDVVAQGN